MPKKFPRSFFLRSPVAVARDLLGARLTTNVRGRLTSGMIVETEAYCGKTDPACHCYKRRTDRTEVMYWQGGHCYVYRIYGIHNCVNVVTGPADVGAAVLIRAVEPLAGVKTMYARRRVKSLRQLTSGPAKVCQALGITKQLWGEDLLTSKLISIAPFRSFADKEVENSVRIGLTKAADLKWRFYAAASEWVSG